MRFLVPIGDMKIGQTPEVLATEALGSCLCLTVYDPILQVGGLLHAMLPLSKINTQKAAQNPFMFVDTGIPELFQRLSEIIREYRYSRIISEIVGKRHAKRAVEG